MKCHYCEREATTVVGEHLKRNVCDPCAEACKATAAWVDTILPTSTLERIFGEAPRAKAKH